MQTITVPKEIYEKTALLKAAYHFINDYYVFIDCNETEYIVSMRCKCESSDDRITDKFLNELLAQTVRLHVYNQTHTIRELLLGRAMASTMIQTEYSPLPQKPSNDKLDNIIEDWFEKHEYGNTV